MFQCYAFTWLCLVARLLGSLSVLQQFPIPLLTYFRMAGPKYEVSQSRSKISHKSQNKSKDYRSEHKTTHTIIQLPYLSTKGVCGGEAAAHPCWGFISGLYKCVGDGVWLLRFLGSLGDLLLRVCDTQHNLGRPFCNMSMEALEMMGSQPPNTLQAF